MQRLVLLSGQKSGERRVQRGPLNYTFSMVVFKQRVTLLYEWPVKGSTCVPVEQVSAEKGVSLLSQFSPRRPGHEPQEAGYCFVQWPRSRDLGFITQSQPKCLESKTSGWCLGLLGGGKS